MFNQCKPAEAIQWFAGADHVGVSKPRSTLCSTGRERRPHYRERYTSWRAVHAGELGTVNRPSENDVPSRLEGKLGRHAGLPGGAKSKHEVAALLCASAVDAGLWPVPEFEIKAIDGRKRCIDVVWAKRDRSGSERVWRPVAAFEIEGHGVARAPRSIQKNADSLSVATAAGARIAAMVLFRVGPTGQLWTPMGVASQAEQLLREALAMRPTPCPVEVVLDEDLEARIPGWVLTAKGG